MKLIQVKGGSQAPRYGCSNLTKDPGGGSASPIVYDDKVFINFWSPVGPDYDAGIVSKLINESGCSSSEVYNRLDLWQIQGEDVIICMDANTGQTLWETKFDGIYRNDHAKLREANNSICAKDGKVFGYTSMGKVFALDANTGDTVWHTDNWSSMETDLINSIVSDAFISQALIGSGVISSGNTIAFAINNNVRVYDISNGDLL